MMPDMEDKELQWPPEFLNRFRDGFTDEEWDNAWIETWDTYGRSGRIYPWRKPSEPQEEPDTQPLDKR